MPEVYLEASVTMVKGAARSGRWRIGFDRKRDLNATMAIT